MIYTWIYTDQYSILDSSFERYPQRPYLGALINIAWPLLALSSDAPCNCWFPPFISDDTPRTGLPASACFDLGERREQVEEIEKRIDRVKR